MRTYKITMPVGLFLVLVCSVKASGKTIVVLAAASLKESFSEIASAYEKLHPDVKVRLAFAGSQQLSSQIALGAPADVFASADVKQMRDAVLAGKVSLKSVKPIAYNRLVIVVSRGSSQKVTGLEGLADKGIKLLVGVPQVPVGAYTEQVLLHASEKFKNGWLDRVKANIVSKELDVRSILTKVQLGVADAGIVYTTDARVAPADKVVTRAIGQSINVNSVYVIAPIAGSMTGADFAKFVLAEQGRRILGSHGFLLPSL